MLKLEKTNSGKSCISYKTFKKEIIYLLDRLFSGAADIEKKQIYNIDEGVLELNIEIRNFDEEYTSRYLKVIHHIHRNYYTADNMNLMIKNLLIEVNSILEYEEDNSIFKIIDEEVSKYSERWIP